MAPDKRQVTDFTGKKIPWEIPPPDNSLHNGMQMYRLKHRVAYLMEEGMVPPQLLSAPDPGHHDIPQAPSSRQREGGIPT